MAVENSFILQKMMEEMEQANRHDGDSNFIKHIERIKLLCELLLDSNAQYKSNNQESKLNNHRITAKEMEAMLGSSRMNQHSNEKHASFLQSEKEEEKQEEANGTSIFDF